MNNRFKFRVWDDAHKEYLPLSDCKLDARSGKLVKQSLFQENRYIIEQCTGLRDKNGKLIFEGDVVKKVFKDDLSMHKEVYYDSVMCRWYLRRCCPGLHSTRQYLFWDFNSSIADKLEIIGNIHEKEAPQK